MVGNAPTSWGVETPDAAANPNWERVLREVGEAGYQGIELGPLGYMPTDGEALQSELQAAGLSLVAGTVMRVLHDPTDAHEVERHARTVCEVLSEHDASFLVLIAGFTPDRVVTAGRSKAAVRLGSDAMAQLCDTVMRCAAIAADFGITAVLHSHAATHIEFEDELERVLEETDPALVRLCLDTGHATYAGIDPVELLRRNRDRVAYLHLKDVAPAARQRAIREGMGFWEAYESGIFCPLGDGMVDFPQIVAELRRGGYRGWLTVEQDAPPALSHLARERAEQSRHYLRSIGVD